MGEGLWEFIERKAREQENVDDSWMLTRLDTWKPMWRRKNRKMGTSTRRGRTSMRAIIYLTLFWLFNMIISAIWYVYELLTIGEIQTNLLDTIVSLILSFNLVCIIDDIVQRRKKKIKKQEMRFS
ncbi:hypothetical protein [Bacillus atrophaeus]|uniref:hypothetical protein n=1 Tax=Bacillus atrophaeus TaxID=1452 RepID=UPI002E249236|nr:hypothetical protein [Bacillus atrophaeus]